MVVELSLAHPELTPREFSVLLLAESEIFVSESSFYRILRQRGLLERRNTVLSMPPMSFAIRLGLPMRCGRPTLSTSMSRAGDCYYLSTVMDYYSRYIIHWELCSSMTGEDDSRTIDRAIKSAGLTAHNPPKLLSDN